MKNKMLTGLFAVFLISVFAFAGIACAYRGDASVQGPNYNEEVHEQLEGAIESGDYDAWVQIREENNLPMRGRMFQVINEDNFYLYKELHDANVAGDTERANEIKAELGLGQGMMKRGSGQGTGAGQKMGSASGQGLRTNAGTHDCGSCPYN